MDTPKLRYNWDGYQGYDLRDSNHLDTNSVKLVGGSILKARVRASSGGWTDTSMCLDFFLTNELGMLVCEAPSQYLCASVAMIRVSQEWNDKGQCEVPLTGLCIGLDGQLHPSRIDLSLHYENHNGMWRKKKNGHFGETAKDVGFDSYGHFNCSLRNWEGNYGYPIDYDLYQDVHNVDGVLTIQDPAGFWDSRGAFFRILEEIPGLGYAVAVADFARGDPRAIAECTLSTIAAVTCFFATTLLGPVGACLAAAAINTGAMLAKEGMKANMGEPSFFTRSVGAAIAGFFFSEFLVIAGTGLGGLVGSYIDMLEEEFVASAIDGMVVDVGLWGGKKALKTLTKEEFKFIMTTVLDIIKKGGSLDDAQAEVDTEIQRWFEETQTPQLKERITTKMTNLGYTWDEQTIVDDIFKAAVAADYDDDTRLQKVIETTVSQIIPDNHDDLVNKITLILKGMNLGDPAKIRPIRLSITRIGYTYTPDLVTKLLGMVRDSDYGPDLDNALKTIFARLPDSDRHSLDDEVRAAIKDAGCRFFESNMEDIESDLVQNEYVYDSMWELRQHLIGLANALGAIEEHHIMPSPLPR
ncbi:hypothetical protein C8A00DRAFT_37985 [Chaetomidium leptoderma]|uniref:Cyanovirin-N domain-containing protein n=1 Tax=Chaetomidium leptoderma TaxID=669021 RepID=A0AAN6VFV7_9PEZI|nr:hypothetical protein C8A00DRAFT_37985 [Chaetomidium leptoderma]